MRIAILILIIGLTSSLKAQRIFSESELVAVVKKYHPIARQAMLDVRIAEANLVASRGAFDPVLSVDNRRKDFDGTTYYDQFGTELKIPTWYGIDLYAGRETIRGDRLNPESTKGRINYAGVSIPLVQNLVMDKRRAVLQQSKVYIQQSEFMRKAALNDLLAEALEAYWEWWEQYQAMEVIQSALQIANARLDMVRTGYQLGSFPAIDTLEATTQVQFFEQQKSEAEMLLQNSRLNLSVYLWSEGDQPYTLTEDAIPQMTGPAVPGYNLNPGFDLTTGVDLSTGSSIAPGTASIPGLDSLLTEASVHPMLVEYDYKLKGLAIEKKLQFQSLLPELRVKYNGIGRDFSKTFEDAFLNNNYRFGLVLSVPLRLSEGRGQYRAAKLKIEQTKLEQVSKQVAIQNKVQQYYNEWRQTFVQYQLQQNLVQNYLGLQKGEETKFANGESSLFLVNSRESKTLDGQRKELALEAKIQKLNVRLKWAAGIYGGD